MAFVYIYVVARDFGFAPNPFHGYCSLATCKPDIRSTAKIGDWVIGVGGGRLKATGKCIFAMLVTQKITFNEYWQGVEYNDKKPLRNGSKKMLLGDNIYYFNSNTSAWEQAPSHHSHADGSINISNKNRDTQSAFVLLSNNFYYFGKSAPIIPPNLLDTIGYKNHRKHRKYKYDEAAELIHWLNTNYSDKLNQVLDDPFDFNKSHKHYSVDTDKIT